MGAVHEELAPPFVDAILNLGHHVKVWLHPGSLSSKGDVFHAYTSKDNRPRPGGQNSDFRVIYRRLLKDVAQKRFIKELKADGIEYAIFLTLQNEWSVKLAEEIQKHGIKVTGIIHNIDKLKAKPVSRFWRANHQPSPIVLAEHVSESLHEKLQLKSKIIHSIFKPKQLPPQKAHLEPSAQKHPYKFAILGGVNFQSRNYEALTDNLDQLTDTTRESILFTIAGGGKDRKALIDLVQKNLKNNFEFIKISPDSNRVKYDICYDRLPNQMPSWSYQAQAMQRKITSALPSAITFGKPVVTSSSLASIYGLHNRSLSYSGETINKALLKFLNTTLLEHFIINERVKQYRQELLLSNMSTIRSLLAS